MCNYAQLSFRKEFHYTRVNKVLLCHGLLPFCRMRCSRACFLWNRSRYRFWQWSSVRCGCLGRNTKCCKLRVRPSDSTSTPRRRDGFFFFRTFLVLFVEASVFCFRRVFIAYYRVSCYIFFSVSTSQHSKTRPCLLRLRWMCYRLCDVVCFIIFSLLSLSFLLASYIILNK